MIVIDAIMKRTQKHPIITGKIKQEEALALDIVTAVLAVLFMVLYKYNVCRVVSSNNTLLHFYIYYLVKKNCNKKCGNRRSSWGIPSDDWLGNLLPMIYHYNHFHYFQLYLLGHHLILGH